jgi:hexosaminidase
MVNGAYAPSLTYSVTQMKEAYDYARERGVELLVELDVPGHAAGWIKGKPSIMADCLVKYSYNINDYALNPTMEETYSTINNILSDIVKATGVKNLHIGGDEVVYGCWKNDSSITTWMAANNMVDDYDQLLAYFVSRADGIVNNLGARAIHWEEVFSAGCSVPEGTLFQVWTDSSKMSALTAANHNVISSPSNYWYLNHCENTWQVMYEYDPCVGLSSTQCSLVVGGETALWGEYVDEANIIQSLYPRAASVAERLWSNAAVSFSGFARWVWW